MPSGLCPPRHNYLFTQNDTTCPVETVGQRSIPEGLSRKQPTLWIHLLKMLLKKGTLILALVITQSCYKMY